MSKTNTTDTTETDEKYSTSAPNPEQVLNPSAETYYISRGNGGTGRAIHKTTECPHLNQTGHNVADPREASGGEVQQAIDGSRVLCSAETCWDYRKKPTGTSNNAIDARVLRHTDLSEGI